MSEAREASRCGHTKVMGMRIFRGGAQARWGVLFPSPLVRSMGGELRAACLKLTVPPAPKSELYSSKEHSPLLHLAWAYDRESNQQQNYTGSRENINTHTVSTPFPRPITEEPMTELAQNNHLYGTCTITFHPSHFMLKNLYYTY